MNSIRNAFSGVVSAVVIFFLGPFRAVRGLMIKTLIMAEESRSSDDSLRWLLNIMSFTENAIDRQCVHTGKGVHLKHELMTGIHSFFYERVPDGAKVLDVGCGIGAVAHSIAKHAQASVTGTDYDSRHIDFARKRFQHPNLKFVVGDATKDLPLDSFDVVVLSSVLEHISDRPALLKTLVKRYRPEKFLIRVPGFERHYHAVLKKKLGMFAYTDWDHKTEYTSESFHSEMQDAGLYVKHMEVRWGDIWAECVPLEARA